MAQKKVPCKNHPDKLTARRCFYCKEPICPSCQLSLSHHLFCSKSCYYKWKCQHFAAKIKFSPESIVLLILLLISNLLIVIYFNSKISDITSSSETQKEVTAKAEPDDSLTVQIDSIRYSMENIFQLRLQVNKGAVAALRRDGRFIESQVQENSPITFKRQYLRSGENKFAVWALMKSGKSVLIDSFTIIFKSARIDYLRNSITKVRTKRKFIALTFDGGSLNKGTAEILNSLKSEGIKCTIFLTGDFIRRYPDLVQRMIKDGHEIGNHSLKHPHLTYLEIDGSNKTLPNVQREFIYKQLLKADSLYEQIAGQPMAPFWRAPYGEINNDILLWAAEAGYKHISWSAKCDTWDWVADSGSSLYRTNSGILNHILKVEEKYGLSGKIILMHLGSDRDGDFPYLILPELIKTLKERGYTFKTISRLLGKGERKN